MDNNNWNYGAISGTGGLTFTLPGTEGTHPAITPRGLLATRAVETKDGWRGQIIIDQEIVFETEPQSSSASSLQEANRRVVNTIRNLFVDPVAT